MTLSSLKVLFKLIKNIFSNAGNIISDVEKFKIFRGSMPHTPLA